MRESFSAGRRHVAAYVLWLMFCVFEVGAQETGFRFKVADSNSIEGRLYAETANQIAIETATQQIRLIPRPSLLSKTAIGPFQYDDANQCAAQLIQEFGAGFQVSTDDGYVICSDSPQIFHRYVARLLDSVRSQFRVFCDKLELPSNPVKRPLQVVIFRSAEQFVAAANRLHPETTFTATPGFYSLRYNTMYVVAPAASLQVGSNSELLRVLKTEPRVIETIVHEAVHQLAYNTGLHQRYADVPLWISEGLAMYFEPASTGSSILWSRPGGTFRFIGVLKQGRSVSLPFEISELTSNRMLLINDATKDPAYAASWATMHYLLKKKPKAAAELLKAFQTAAPLQAHGRESLQLLLKATGESASFDLQRRITSHISRLRAPR